MVTGHFLLLPPSNEVIAPLWIELDFHGFLIPSLGLR